MFRTETVQNNLAAEPPPKRRARLTNNPVARANLNSRTGRRVADLYRAYCRLLGGPADAVQQANALAAAELKTAAEEARVAVLAGNGNAEQLVRLENLAARAERRLGLTSSAQCAARAARAADRPGASKWLGRL